MENNKITYFAETDFRDEQKRFGIKRADRRKHMYIIGKTGMGKTTLLENMAVQDIVSGEGIGIIDPHGEFAEKMLDYVPAHRVKDVVYFNPVDTEFPIGFNVLEQVEETQRFFVASGLMGAFKKIWPDVWSARMEYILSNTILALLEYPGSTILGINRMLSVKEYRKDVVNNITDPVVRAFWTEEFAKYTERFAAEAVPAIQNKVGQFVSNPLIRNIIGQPHSSFDIRRAMDDRKILIINLSKGRIGEENSRLLGAMLITKLYLAAMTRVDIANEEERKDFYLYVDEFQNFATESFASILSEARKYRLNLILAHQYITQMDETVRDAVFGNVGTMVTFRIGAADAEFLEKEFSPVFLVENIVNLAFANIYLRLMIDGVASQPFSSTTLPPIPPSAVSSKKHIIQYSREQYGRAYSEVAASIAEQSGVLQTKEIQEAAQKNETAPAAASASGFAAYEEVEPPKKPELYDARCSNCDKLVKVPFKPDASRPIYCKTCRKKFLEKKENPQMPRRPDSAAAPVQRREERGRAERVEHTHAGTDARRPAEAAKEQRPVPMQQSDRERQRPHMPDRSERRFPPIRDGVPARRREAPFTPRPLSALKKESREQTAKPRGNEKPRPELGELRAALKDAIENSGSDTSRPSSRPESTVAPSRPESHHGILRPGQSVRF